MIEIINYNKLKSILVALKNKLPIIMANYVSREMKPGEVHDKPYWRKGKKLENQSGKLWRSFFRAGESNVTNINLSGWNITGVFGSDLPYASIHEKGGYIGDRSKIADGKRKGMAGVIQRYFWYKYFETGFEWYKIMALSVRKKGFIKIPARPYFDKAMKEFQRDGIPKIIDNIINSLRTA